jgi:hypothetical protein
MRLRKRGGLTRLAEVAEEALVSRAERVDKVTPAPYDNERSSTGAPRQGARAISSAG